MTRLIYHVYGEKDTGPYFGSSLQMIILDSSVPGPNYYRYVYLLIFC